MKFPAASARADALMRRVAVAAVVTASFLVALKAGAYFLTHSVAMLASLADSALDVFASLVNLLAVRHALTPADDEHRFGHGKAEPLAGLLQSAFISGSVAFLIIESLHRLTVPHQVYHSDVGLAVMAIAIVATLGLVAAQDYVVRRTHSIAIGADRLHYLGDILVNIGVAIGIYLAANGGMLDADPVVGLVVAGVLSVGVVQVFRQSYDQLMDRELPDSERGRIEAIVGSHPDVRDMHELRTRTAGRKAFIQLHIELDPQMTLRRSHEVSEEVAAQLCKSFPDAEIIIHQDPETPR
jgi:ferrous-iron efflux pump FieF